MSLDYNDNDNQDYEIINGQIYMMARPTLKHNRIAFNINKVFDRFLKGKICESHIEPDVFLDEINNFIPDVVILCDKSKIHDDDKGIYGAPDLVVEILSPSTAKRDIAEKKDTYEKFGVKEYWLVRPELKEITVYHLKGCCLAVDNVYYYRTKAEYDNLKEQDQKAIISKFKTTLFTELEIDLEEVFENIF